MPGLTRPSPQQAAFLMGAIPASGDQPYPVPYQQISLFTANLGFSVLGFKYSFKINAIQEGWFQ